MERSLAGYSPWGLKELDMTEVTECACTREAQLDTWTPGPGSAG